MFGFFFIVSIFLSYFVNAFSHDNIFILNQFNLFNVNYYVHNNSNIFIFISNYIGIISNFNRLHFFYLIEQATIYDFVKYLNQEIKI